MFDRTAAWFDLHSILPSHLGKTLASLFINSKAMQGRTKLGSLKFGQREVQLVTGGGGDNPHDVLLVNRSASFKVANFSDSNFECKDFSSRDEFRTLFGSRFVPRRKSLAAGFSAVNSLDG